MVSRSQIKIVQSLKLKKYRQKYGLFCVSGDKIVRELLTGPAADWSIQWNIHKIYALSDWAEEHAGLLQPHSEVLEVAKQAELEKLSPQQSPNGVLAIVEIPTPKPPEAISNGWWLALDRMRDPGNLGTIIRTADWFGLAGVLCSTDCADRFNPKVVQASMGSLFRVPVHYCELNEVLSATSLSVLGAAMDGESMYEQDFAEDGILLIGNEAQGILQELNAQIDQRVSIPGRGGAESLNATVATAVLLGQIMAPRLAEK